MEPRTTDIQAEEEQVGDLVLEEDFPDGGLGDQKHEFFVLGFGVFEAFDEDLETQGHFIT